MIPSTSIFSMDAVGMRAIFVTTAYHHSQVVEIGFHVIAASELKFYSLFHLTIYLNVSRSCPEKFPVAVLVIDDLRCTLCFQAG